MSSSSFAPLLSFFRYFRPDRDSDLDTTLRRKLKSWAESFQPPEDNWESILRRIEEMEQEKLYEPQNMSKRKKSAADY